MKKANMFIMIILMLSGMIGCSQNAETYTAESLYTESTSVSAEDSDTTELEEIKEKEEESSGETSNESVVSDVNENKPESTATTTSPTPTNSASPPITTDTPPESATTTTPSPSPTERTVSAYTQKDFDEIISVIREYAESQTKLKFIWNPALNQDQFIGWHGTPCLTQRGKDKTIATLKYHVDLTADVLTNPANGMVSDTVEYNILNYEEDKYFFEGSGKNIFFVLVYG